MEFNPNCNTSMTYKIIQHRVYTSSIVISHLPLEGSINVLSLLNIREKKYIQSGILVQTDLRKLNHARQKADNGSAHMMCNVF